MDSQRVLSDRYALLSHLARGGMADVYVAQDRRLGRQVAVKILHTQYAESEAFIERFRREAQAAANLTHPGVVAVYDWGEDDGTYFMVMELVQGRNLRDVVRSEGALLPRRVAEIGVAVASALSAAHAQGLVHRDIKPANILLTADGAVKVADFGIARAFDDSDQLTRTGAVIGTATYFSPEQAQGHPADSRSDIYSLGVVMYELLVGHPPFSGESPVAVAYQHVREEPEPPSTLNPNVPPGLEAIVLAAMAKHPDDRYQTADDLGADLKRLLAGQVPLAAPQNEAPTRMMPAAGGGNGYPEDPYRPPTRTYVEPPYREPGRADRTTIAIGILAGLAVLGLGLILLFKLLGPSAETTTVVIPDLRGQEVAAAESRLADLEFTITQESVADDEIAAGLVAGTDPAANTEVDRGSAVTLLVSAGPANVEVPGLVGRTRVDAEALLAAAGLSPGVITFEQSPTVASGEVMAQSPDPGTLVSAGAEVNMVISAGVDALVVPDVAGKSEADAVFQLSAAGFESAQIIIERRPSADVIEGFVIETDPAAGAVVPVDGSILVAVSQGAVPSVVPNVVGMSEQDATTKLEDFGFVVKVGDPIEVPVDDPNAGFVAQQEPAAGSTQEFGSQVTIHLGEPGTETTVPDVVGLTESDAQQAIEAAGLTFATGQPMLVAAGDPSVGRVISQDPPGGRTREVGATVTVIVGAEGVIVPNLFSSGSGGCPSAITPGQAENRITGAGLDMASRTGSDEYSYSSVPADNTHQCEGRTIQQSPPPGTIVAAGSTVTVTFDLVMTPLDDDIFGKSVAQAQADFPLFTFTQATSQGGECFDPAFAGTIRRIDPAPDETLPATGSTWRITYWIATATAGPDTCPPWP